MGVFERFELQNGLRVLTAPMAHAQSVSCIVMLAAGSRYETPETNGIAHFAEHMFFKGTERRPTARDIAGEIDSIGGEFNAFTGKEYTGYYVRCAAADARHGARRPRGHAPQLPLRPGRDRAREGRDRRGDEHVLRHAARLHRRGLRVAPLRRPAARLGHHRPQGDGSRRDARDVPRLHRQVVPAEPDGLRHRRPARRRPAGAARSAPRRPGAAGDGLARAGSPERRRAREGAHEAVRPGTPRPRRPQPPAHRPGPVRPAAARDRARRRHVVAPLHRGARAPRASRTTSSARTTRTPTRARSMRSPVSTSTGSTRP